jgi:tRNA(Ile)-lysidine synthase
LRGAHPERALEEHLRRSDAIRPGHRIVVACSGGPDSVALAALLAALADPMKLTLSMAHVNHGTRASAWQDECVAMRVAAALEMPLDVAAPAIAGSGETAMREARYSALLSIARERGATTVATAHNAEDQTETVLLALFRGSGPRGLTGMPARRPLDAGIDVVRPLLRIPPEDLRYYCHVKALPYAVDPTNEHTTLRRNAVREALAELRPSFPGLDEAVARAAELVGGERRGTERAAMRRRVRETLEREAGLHDVDFTHVEAAVRTMERGGNGRFLMRKDVTLRVEPAKKKER